MDRTERPDARLFNLIQGGPFLLVEVRSAEVGKAPQVDPRHDSTPPHWFTIRDPGIKKAGITWGAD